uniref:Uncharacterized protein n=1 Tax=Papilio xuthus TaxID=66420 RepID=I4DQN3_PAPXU|nr:unknown unsecreted protein [Papilio xuthus]
MLKMVSSFYHITKFVPCFMNFMIRCLLQCSWSVLDENILFNPKKCLFSVVYLF